LRKIPPHLWPLKFLVVFTLWPGALTADQKKDAAPAIVDFNGPPPAALAHRVEIRPKLDGNVLEDPAWSTTKPLTGFWQSRPDPGFAATEKTEVRILYTNDTLFFGVVCYDSTPEGIISSDSRRDSSLMPTDSFQIILDTYHDRQNGFLFGTNPAAVEYDAQISNEGVGSGSGRGRSQGGSGGGFNINWDGSWNVAARISEIGWSAEFAIPFKTLRYPQKEEQTWGINFQRNIRRRNEIVYWAPLDGQHRIYRLSRAGRLENLQIPRQANLKITPYALSVARAQGELEPDWERSWGVDAKYSLTPSLTLDATYNTDFAQVEVDAQQINLDRFNLFFPEKRPFFLENAGLFAMGDSGEAELFFTRRIGISSAGAPIPILGGGRLTGKVSGFNVGLLSMQTKTVDDSNPGNNFTVGRISRELPNRSSLGAIVISRQASNSAVPGDHNRTYGFDGRFGFGQHGTINGFLAKTATPGLRGNDLAFKIRTEYDASRWRFQASYSDLGEDFNPEVGFLRRPGGYRKFNGVIYHRFKPDFMGFYEIRPHVFYNGYWGRDGVQQSGRTHIDTHWEWRNGYRIDTGMNLTQEGVSESFEVFPGVTIPEGSYEHTEAQLRFHTDRGRPLSFSTFSKIGGFFGGTRTNMQPSVTFRTSDSFNVTTTWGYNYIALPNGEFQTNLISLRSAYSFNPRLYLQGFVQYNDRANLWSSNLRFAWLSEANTGLFLVYDDTRGLAGLDSNLIPDRSLTIKYSRLFDLFN